ncbi:TPA: nucleotidyltransferase domain-containing protein, partial [Candidatus Bathyarchaeota archaeon]|nr:nucleotidyltransferase domain-containing protein [Candidatus Bathyarchaeota archaeon]
MPFLEIGILARRLVHGSFVRDTSFRDVDVAVYVAGSVDPLDCEFRLERELRGALGLPVDVRLLNEAPPWFTARVLREGTVLVGKVGLSEGLYLRSMDEEMAMEAATAR